MTRDLQEIKQGLAQIRATLNLLEQLIAGYENRTVNILPQEDILFHSATDDEIISGRGLGKLRSLNEAIHQTAETLAIPETA